MAARFRRVPLQSRPVFTRCALGRDRATIACDAVGTRARSTNTICAGATSLVPPALQMCRFACGKVGRCAALLPECANAYAAMAFARKVPSKR